MDNLDYMPLLGAPNGMLSRRSFFATASSVVASSAIATATIAAPVASNSRPETEIERLSNQLPGLWEGYQSAVKQTEAAWQTFHLACSHVPPELLIETLPPSLQALVRDHMPKTGINRTASHEDSQTLVSWINATGWEMAIDHPAYWLCLTNEMNRADAVSWLQHRRSLAHAYEHRRSSMWDSLVVAAEVSDRAAYDKFCEVEDALLEACPTSIPDLKMQATAASRVGIDQDYEIQPERAAALVAAVLHFCGGRVL